MENRNLFDAGIVIAVVTLFFFIVRIVRRNYNVISRFMSIDTEEIIELKQHIKELEAEIKTLRGTVEILVEQLRRKEQPVVVESKRFPARPVLLVFGNAKFGEEDRQALRRAGVSFFRLINAKLDDLQNEIQRRRSDGTLYDIIHFAAVGRDDGYIDLNGQFVDGEQLANVLSGVRGVFLSTCTNHYVADKLVGVVKYVVVIYEEIEGADAANFVYEFYKRYVVSQNIEESFRGAIEVLPGIAEFVDLRKGT